MRNAETALTDNDYPISLLENTSVKIVRRTVLTCAAAGCTVALKPLDSVQVPSVSDPQAQL